MTSKVVLITGANSGIGFAIVKALCQSRGQYNIVLCGRSIDKAETAADEIRSEFPDSPSTITTTQLDITDDSSIQSAAAAVSSKYGRLDILINNAGASFDVPIAQGTISAREGWAASWDVNVTGTHLVTEAFVPLLLTSSDPRLIFLTSGTSSLAETTNTQLPINKSPPRGWPKPQLRTIISYRCSKTGLNMLMLEWARILREDNVKVFALAPGFLATGLGGEDLKKLGAGDPSIGGEAVRKVVEGERDADVTKVVRNYMDSIQPW